MPGPALLQGLAGYLGGDTRRPMTDLVRCLAPEAAPYRISFEWHARRGAELPLAEIARRVGEAAGEYALWQGSAIGRDINPSELERRVMEVPGVHRAAIAAPAYAPLSRGGAPAQGAFAPAQAAVLEGAPEIALAGYADE
jgi:phage-related baseplate assembly protein